MSAGTISFTSFTPNTQIKSAEMNTNFTTAKTALESIKRVFVFPIGGTLYVGTNLSFEVPAPVALTIQSCRLRVKTAPTSADIIVDLNKNGTSVFSTRPTIAAGAVIGGAQAVISTTNLTAGDYVSIDIDQIGSGTAGADLIAELICSEV